MTSGRVGWEGLYELGNAPGLPITNRQVGEFARAVGIRWHRALEIIRTIHDDPSVIGATHIEWPTE